MQNFKLNMERYILPLASSDHFASAVQLPSSPSSYTKLFQLYCVSRGNHFIYVIKLDKRLFCSLGLNKTSPAHISVVCIKLSPNIFLALTFFQPDHSTKTQHRQGPATIFEFLHLCQSHHNLSSLPHTPVELRTYAIMWVNC